jgi:hypothetical protein
MQMTSGIIVSRIPERIVEGRRLGRHVRHDPRSAAYRVTRRADTELKSVVLLASNDHALDQLDLGACTGFSSAQALNCEPFGLHLTAKEAREIYSLATTKDDWEGSWPPIDTGSSGLAAMKACRELGYIKSWSSAYTLTDVLHGLQSGPGIFGCSWFDGCEDLDPNGCVAPLGEIRGGHEIAIVGCDFVAGRVLLRNSWGDGFGMKVHDQTGYFWLSFQHFETLLALTGDAYFPSLI